MRVRELLDVPDLGLRLLTDIAGMDRAIRCVYTTDLPDPSRYLKPGALVLTGLMWCRAPGDADQQAAEADLYQLQVTMIAELVDAYGQSTRAKWPEKISSDEQLKSAAAKSLVFVDDPKHLASHQ